MSKKILNETNYSFDPITATIRIPRYIPQETLLLITNVSSSTGEPLPIYNCNDSKLNAISYTSIAGQEVPKLNGGLGGIPGSTVIVLKCNTSSMNRNDKLQIWIDEYEEKIIPSETYTDSANKWRVSTQQSLIDTDFELGLQPTKWEFYQDQNFCNSFYIRPTDTPLAAIYSGAGFSITNVTFTVTGNTGVITGLTMPRAATVGSYVYIIDSSNNNNFSGFRYPITASTPSSIQFTVLIPSTTYNVQLVIVGSVEGTVNNPTMVAVQVANDISSTGSNLQPGQPIQVQETRNELYCDGTFLINFVNQLQKTFSYLPKNSTFRENQLELPSTTIYAGFLYGSTYSAGPFIPIVSLIGNGIRTVTVITLGAHNLLSGAPIAVASTTSSAANGSFYVTSVPSSNSFTYSTYSQVTSGSIILSTTTLITRPEGYQIHRPYDGGASITPGNNVIGARAIRQTRRYFRYQSGKGIQFCTAATFKPNYDITSISINGQIATVTVDQDHGLRPGSIIKLVNLQSVSALDDNIFNNVFTVLASQPITAKSFSIRLSSIPVDTNPGGTQGVVEIMDAKGFNARLGLFDDQNGFFWEYDGTYLNAVRRNSTTQLLGTIYVCTGSTVVVGTNTRFTKQLTAGDRVVIRGFTYEISSVINDNVLNISPSYRPPTPSDSAGVNFSSLLANNSNILTLNLSSSTTLQSFTVVGVPGSGSIGTSGAFVMQANLTRTAVTTGTQTTIGSRTIVVASSTGLVPGLLITATNGIPSNTYIDLSYVVGSTTVPITNATTGTMSATTVAFYFPPGPGMSITGTGIGSSTQIVSMLNPATNTAVTIPVTLTLNRSISSTIIATSYTIGFASGSSSSQTINLSNISGLQTGMSLFINNTSVGIITTVGPFGSYVSINQPLTTTFANGSTVQGIARSGDLYAVSQLTNGVQSQNSNKLTLVDVSGIRVGSMVYYAGGSQIPIGSIVTSINQSTKEVVFYTPFLDNQGIQGSSIASGQTIVFGSRVYIYNSSQINANGIWPVTSVNRTTNVAQIAVASTVPTTGSLTSVKIFSDEAIEKKYLIQERRTSSYNFNLDRLDGTGPSGYNLDITKIQMIFLDYSWYGAGFVRFGLRTVNGDLIYCHKVQNNNREYQAETRTGNLPARFEVVNYGARSIITADIPNTGFTINSPGVIRVQDASRYFIPYNTPDGSAKNGSVIIDGEIFYYTGVDATTGLAPWAVNPNGVTSLCLVNEPEIIDGVLISIPIIFGGAGYTSAPPISIVGGGGAGASAIPIVSNGTILRIIVTNGGSGYTSSPTIIIGANRLTGCYRENSLVLAGALQGTPITTTGSTAITGVTNIDSLMVGMTLEANSVFGGIPVKITGIIGSSVFVNQPATAPAQLFISPINQGIATPLNHYTFNTLGLPVSNALSLVQQLTPSIQHWGVNVISDGRVDNDKSYVITTPKQAAAVLFPNTTVPILSIRSSPSASSGIGRGVGIKEFFNRMQVNLYNCQIFNSGPFLITIRYNCSSSVFTTTNWQTTAVGSGSLSQVIYHNTQDIVTGGDVVGAFYSDASGGTFFNSTVADLTNIKDLGNSLASGDATYPDGPDCITFFATNLSTISALPIYVTVAWTESQS